MLVLKSGEGSAETLRFVIERAFCVGRICGEILPKQKEERRGGGGSLQGRSLPHWV